MKMLINAFSILLSGSTLVLVSCSSQYLADPAFPPPATAQHQPSEQYDYSPKMLPQIDKHFIKKRIAVARFGDNIPVADSPFGHEAPSTSVAQVGTVNVSTATGDIADKGWLSPEDATPMSRRFTEKLIHELHKSKRFVIVERKNINDVLRELNFQNTKYVSKQASEKIGDVLGAQIIVTGAIGGSDEYNDYWYNKRKEWYLEDQDFKSKIEKQGVQNADYFLGLDSMEADTIDKRLARQKIKKEARRQIQREIELYQIKRRDECSATVEDAPPANSIYMRVYDVGTGRIVDSVNVEGRTEKELLKKAVRKLLKSIEQVPWTGQIASVSADFVYINAGRNMGMSNDAEFIVLSVGQEIKDPATGVVLGYEEEPVGRIKVMDVKDKLTKAKITSGAGKIKVGDKVKFP